MRWLNSDQNLGNFISTLILNFAQIKKKAPRRKKARGKTPQDFSLFQALFGWLWLAYLIVRTVIRLLIFMVKMISRAVKVK